MSKQGLYANQFGGTLENLVISVFESKGFRVISYKEYQLNSDQSDNLLIKNAPFTTIYGHSGKTEFLLISKSHSLELRIECKWQQVAGSVDEKFPYVYLNCIEAIPENDILIIIDGAGAKKGSVQWLKDACKNKLYVNNNKCKNILIMSTVEFIAWANKTFR